MAKRVKREQERKLVELIFEAIQKKIPPAKEVMKWTEGLAEVQLSLADRIDEVSSWVEVSIETLKRQKAGKVDIKRLQRLNELVSDSMVALIYSAHMLVRQRLEILQLRQQLEKSKK